jgi:hypothetical protein
LHDIALSGRKKPGNENPLQPERLQGAACDSEPFPEGKSLLHRGKDLLVLGIFLMNQSRVIIAGHVHGNEVALLGDILEGSVVEGFRERGPRISRMAGSTPLGAHRPM